jgi:hypothetical protein
VDWRNYMTEEAEALMHASVGMNKAMKSALTLALLVAITGIAFGVLNSVIGSMGTARYFVAMLFDSASMTFPILCFGLYTNLPFQASHILSSMPFMMMIFFSTTFSPGAGVEGVKGLRFLFSRFYFWCMVSVVKDKMEGCPADDALGAYAALAGCLGLALFLVVQAVRAAISSRRAKKSNAARSAAEQSTEFKQLQAKIFRSRDHSSSSSGAQNAALADPASGVVMALP